ncbi:MAG: DUF3618 domain-containing protein [Mesorhizobium sp.]|nr:MAG: DUF3618 domain-containing protein [Mesorhizobium sp.]
MSDKSAAELERDADIARAKLTDTADSIRSKMTPGQLMDEFTGLFAGGDLSSMMDNLRTQVRDNPLPLTMVGAGLAWLMLGKGTSPDSYRGPNSPVAYGVRGGDNARSDGRGGSQGDANGETGAGPGASLSSAAESITAAASSATESVVNVAADAKSALSAATERLGSGAGQAGRSAQDVLQGEPLAVAAMGLLVGTVIGAMLPHTQTEDENLGALSEDLRDSAQKVFERGVEQVKDVASQAYDAANQEADRQGLSGEGAENLVGKVDQVVRTTLSKTDEAVRERLAGAGESSEPA